MKEDFTKKAPIQQNMVKKSLVYMVGNFSSRMMGTLIIPIYAIYLSVEDLGKYDFQQTVASFLMPIIVLAIWESILKFGLGREELELKKIISTALIISAVTLSITFISLVILYSFLYGLNITTFLYILMIIFTPLVTLFQYISRTIGKNRIFVKSGVLASAVNLSCLLLFVIVLRLELFGLLISFIFSQLINIIYISVNIKIWELIAVRYFDRVLGIKLLTFSIPLILNLVFGWFITGFNRFYVNLVIGVTANGIFAFGSKFSQLVNSVGSVINMAAIEDAVLSSGSEGFIGRFEKNVNNIFKILILIIIVIMPIIGSLYYFISNKSYQDSLILIPCLMLGTVMQIMSTSVGNIFSVYNKTQYIFFTSLLGAIINIICAIVLAPIMGLQGIAIAQLAGGMTLFLSRYIGGRRLEFYCINWIKLGGLVIVFVLVSVVSVCSALWLNILLSIILCILFLFLYKEFVKKAILKIKRK